MNENWMALLVAILHPDEITPEKAFSLLYPEDIDEQTRDFMRLRASGMTYRQIGAIYGITRQAVHLRIKCQKARGIIKAEVDNRGKE